MLKKLAFSWILGLMLAGGFMGCGDSAPVVPDTSEVGEEPKSEEAPAMNPDDIPKE